MLDAVTSFADPVLATTRNATTGPSTESASPSSAQPGPDRVSGVVDATHREHVPRHPAPMHSKCRRNGQSGCPLCRPPMRLLVVGPAPEEAQTCSTRKTTQQRQPRDPQQLDYPDAGHDDKRPCLLRCACASFAASAALEAGRRQHSPPGVEQPWPRNRHDYKPGILTSIVASTLAVRYDIRERPKDHDIQCLCRSALIAQGIEHRFPKPCVAGSNPAGGTVTLADSVGGAPDLGFESVPDRRTVH